LKFFYAEFTNKFGDEERQYVLSIVLPLKVAGIGQDLSGAGLGLAAKPFGHDLKLWLL
jgi:hypothetical protein